MNGNKWKKKHAKPNQTFEIKADKKFCSATMGITEYSYAAGFLSIHNLACLFEYVSSGCVYNYHIKYSVHKARTIERER